MPGNSARTAPPVLGDSPNDPAEAKARRMITQLRKVRTEVRGYEALEIALLAAFQIDASTHARLQALERRLAGLEQNKNGRAGG